MDATMELDDFKSAWQTLDRRLAQQNAIKLAEFRDRKLGAARASLRPSLPGSSTSDRRTLAPPPSHPRPRPDRKP